VLAPTPGCGPNACKEWRASGVVSRGGDIRIVPLPTDSRVGGREKEKMGWAKQQHLEWLKFQSAKREGQQKH